jgi:hypothetical protein
LCDVIAAIDPELFKSCFLAWVEALRADTPEVIAIDGKTSRRSHDRRKGRLPLHTVSAWATSQLLVLGQETVAEKSNEITAIPLLLRRLELRGALVTIDATGTQKEIAQTIIDGGGDYVLSLKENWPATYAKVEKVFADPPPSLALTGARPSMATMVVLKPAATPCATLSIGCSPTGVILANSGSPVWLLSA